MSKDSKEEKISFVSKRFGEFTVSRDAIIRFPSGIIGFPEFKEYVLLEYRPPFCWLHSIENPDLAFVVIDGVELGDQYVFPLPYGDADCDLREDDEYAILVIITVRSDPKLITANLKAPLVVNLRNRNGVQLVLEDLPYSTREPLIFDGSNENNDAEKEQKKETSKSNDESDTTDIK